MQSYTTRIFTLFRKQTTKHTMFDLPPPPASTSQMRDEPTQTARPNRIFTCPWPSAQRSIWSELRQWPFERSTPGEDSDEPISVIKPYFISTPQDGTLPEKGARHRQFADDGSLQATWLGHATVLVQFGSALDVATTSEINVLFDPVFSHRASPFSSVGPKRRLPVPCSVSSLPTIHAVCVSHNHYDHLDVHTIRKLVEHDTAKATLYFVPLGCGKVLLEAGVSLQQIREKNWWENEDLHFGTERVIKITCTPAQHNSSRLLIDLNKTLWSSWVVQHEEALAPMTPFVHDDLKDGGSPGIVSERHVKVSSVFHGGDTGYRHSNNGPVCPVFSEIGQIFGPIDLAFIPVWRGGLLSRLNKLGLRVKPEAWTRKNHLTPEDAVDVHRDIRARTSIAIHHSTFVGDEEALWSIRLLQKACETSDGVRFRRLSAEKRDGTGEIGEFVVLDVGGSLVV